MGSRAAKWSAGIFIPKEAEQLKGLPVNAKKEARSYTSKEHISFPIMICEAMKHNKYLYFDYRQHGIILHMTGQVHYYNEDDNQLHIVDIAGRARYLDAGDIVHLEILKEW